MKSTLTNVLFILWLALVPLIFVALALLTHLNPYVLVGIMFASNAVGVNLSRAEKQSPYERAMMYNSESFKSGLLIISFCIYAAFVVCLFVDWQIALIGFVGALLLAGFVEPLFHWVIVIPMCLLLDKLMEFGRK
jgi:hypothetical protein